MDEKYLQTVSVHEHLQHGDATHVDILYLLRGDVLSLCQLEDVLFSVDDAQRPILAEVQTH